MRAPLKDPKPERAQEDLLEGFLQSECEPASSRDALTPASATTRESAEDWAGAENGGCRGLTRRAVVRDNLFPDEVLCRTRERRDTCSPCSQTYLSCLGTSEMGLVATDGEFYVCVCALKPSVLRSGSNWPAIRRSDGPGPCEDGGHLSPSLCLSLVNGSRDSS